MCVIAVTKPNRDPKIQNSTVTQIHYWPFPEKQKRSSSRDPAESTSSSLAFKFFVETAKTVHACHTTSTFIWIRKAINQNNRKRLCKAIFHIPILGSLSCQKATATHLPTDISPRGRSCRSLKTLGRMKRGRIDNRAICISGSSPNRDGLGLRRFPPPAFCLQVK